MRRELIKYYKEDYEPWLPENYQWRLFFFLKDGKGIKARVHKVADPKEYLRELILKVGPEQCYYRVSQFLQPDKVKKRAASDRFIMSDLVFDIDMPDLASAKEETFKLVDWLKKHGYGKPEIRYSGKKGFHLIYQCFFKGLTEKEVLIKSKEIQNEVMAMGIKIDPQITGDSRRVVGLPGTVHECGNKREIVDITDLANFQPSSIFALGTAKKGRMTAGADTPLKAPLPRTLNRKRADTKATPLPELGSSILKTKGRHVLIKKLLKGPDFSTTLENAVRGLPHYYLFEASESIVYLVCIKSFNLNELGYAKKQEFLPMCHLTLFVEKEPCVASRGHVAAFKALGWPVPEMVKEYCGSSRTKVFKPLLTAKAG